LLLAPLTVTLTDNGCVVVTLEEDGVTEIVGATFASFVTVTEFEPVARLQIDALKESGV
jgi:hypothetical protein